MFKVGDIIMPRTEYLNPGEIAKPVIVLDVWDSDQGERISIIDCEEAAQIANGTLRGFPHSRQDTFSEYYIKFEN